MPVHIKRDLNVRVSQDFLNGFRVCPEGDQQGGTSVAQIMESGCHWQSCCCEDRFEIAHNVIRSLI
jgi:hypothetical protein